MIPKIVFTKNKFGHIETHTIGEVITRKDLHPIRPKGKYIGFPSQNSKSDPSENVDDDK